MQAEASATTMDGFTFIRESEWAPMHMRFDAGQDRQVDNISYEAGNMTKSSEEKESGQGVENVFHEFKEHLTELKQDYRILKADASNYFQGLRELPSKEEVHRMHSQGLIDRWVVAEISLVQRWKKMQNSDDERYNDWHLRYNDAFALAYQSTLPSLADTLVNVTLLALIETAERCRICNLILRAMDETADTDGNIRLKYSYAALRTAKGRRVLRFSTGPGVPGKAKPHVPIGRPILTDYDRSIRLQLMRIWLRQCDDSHICNKSIQEQRLFPTRVIDVSGVDEGPGWIRLVDGGERKSNAYIALSHCWGELSDEEKQTFCTSTQNISRRRRGFHVSELPKTFQDAVKVTRAMDIPYLWIDSICIIQFGDDNVDWNHEAIRMVCVYSGAYCTIAATSAANAYSGFVDTHYKTESVCIQDSKGRQFFASTDVDDFDKDVLESPLNKRAWVFQESVLSRRIVHFSANQMYWECGKGVYCENLTRLKSPSIDKYFTMDPAFPSRILSHLSSSMSNGTSFQHCVIFLLEEYSRRKLKFSSDRPFAFAGLEQRIAEVFKSYSRFGVLERYLHYNLLWEPSGDRNMLRDTNNSAPSWSWMSYPGPVKIQRGLQSAAWTGVASTSLFDAVKRDLKTGVDGLDVNAKVGFRADASGELHADLAVLVHATMRRPGEDNIPSLDLDTDHVLHSANGKLVGLLRFDYSGRIDMTLDGVFCVVLARFDGQLMMGMGLQGVCYECLLVEPAGDEDVYRRIGMCMVEGEYVDHVKEQVRIV